MAGREAEASHDKDGIRISQISSEWQQQWVNSWTMTSALQNDLHSDVLNMTQI